MCFPFYYILLSISLFFLSSSLAKKKKTLKNNTCEIMFLEFSLTNLYKENTIIFHTSHSTSKCKPGLPVTLALGVHGHVEGEEVRGESLVVGIQLLHLPHHLLLVSLCQQLHITLTYYVTEIWRDIQRM